MRIRVSLCAVAVLLAAVPLAGTAATANEAKPKPPSRVDQTGTTEPIPGQYMVTLNPGGNPQAILDTLGVSPLYIYNTAVVGFAAKLASIQVELLRKMPEVKSVEQDAMVNAVQERGSRIPAPQAQPIAASWGIDRINQRDLPLDGTAGVTMDGSTVTAYILDTGIDYGHAEFGGRATPGYDAIGDGRKGADCQGHGTHVAGTVAGATYGVAPKAKLVSVRVLGCDGRGTWSGVVAGFDWVAQHAVKPAVANVSLGGTPASSTVDQAGNGLADSGVFVAVAAGNSSADACNFSPARAARVFTIGAVTKTDEYAGYSNRGGCVQLLAPGTDIVSARMGGGSVTLSGTSMASPHVAGAAALYKHKFGDDDQDTIMLWLWNNATLDKVSVMPTNTPNLMLYIGDL